MKYSRGMGPVTVAAGLLIDSEGRILITQRAEHKPRGGLWELPGGKVEQGETCADALRRELAEELGVEAEILGPVGSNLHNYSDVTVELRVFKAKCRQALRSDPEAIKNVAWVPPEHLPSYSYCPAVLPFIEAAACQV